MSTTDSERADDRAASSMDVYAQHAAAAVGHVAAAEEYRRQNEGALVVQHMEDARLQAQLAQAAATAAVADQVAALAAHLREQAR